MRAGWGVGDITPPLGVELAGYGYYLERRATSVQDSLFARSLALESGEERYAALCCDALGLNASVVSQVKAHLKARWGVPEAHVFIVSIHTHTGPAFKYHEGCGQVDPDYINRAARPMLEACDQAFADLAEVTGLWAGCAELAGAFAYNRAAPDGPLDSLVRGFRLERRGAAPIAIASFACHAVARGRSSAISADYPGRVCALLAERGQRPIYWNGLCGDIDPLPCEDMARDERLEAFAQAVVRAYEAALRPCPLDVSGGRLPWTLRLLPATRTEIRDTADQAVARAADPGAQQVARIWEREMLERFDTLSETQTLSVAWLRLGGVPIVALPFEGFTRTGLLIRETLGDPRAFVLGCAEELLGYLPTRDDIERKAYAALESTFLYKRLPALAGEAERLGTDLGALLATKA